ncbi:unnamed protein product [Nippostrongylus brasiliensis]|uniref:Peptidase A2 domain-containing protein n=1 Tax=Nippostrongylus brasiliensis TaxID=27835 RepID=A0A0N4YM77_NIPBR|nr:unnamed protein product [Nippostrongylus brasiliensis]
MTALGSIWNYNPNQFEQVLFFSDTGAQETIIKEETTKFFGLPSHKTEQVTMSGLGGHTEKFESNCGSIKISDAHGTVFDLHVYTKPVITRAVRNFRFRVPNSGFRPFLALPFRFAFRSVFGRNTETEEEIEEFHCAS